MIELALAVGVRIEDPVIDHPEPLGGGIDVHQRDHPDPPDDALLVAAPLLARYLDLWPKALLQHGVIEDQIRLRVLLKHRLDLLEEQSGRQLLAFEVSVYGVVAEALEMIGHVGQGVVDLATQQILAIVQLRKAHAFRVADSYSA